MISLENDCDGSKTDSLLGQPLKGRIAVSITELPKVGTASALG